MKLRFTLRATLLLNSSICDFGTVRVSCSAFPPNDLHRVSRYIARCPLGVLFIVPFRKQVRISCPKVIIALQNGSLSTNRTHTAFDPCFDDGFPFIAAGSRNTVTSFLDMTSKKAPALKLKRRCFRVHRLLPLIGFHQQGEPYCSPIGLSLLTCVFTLFCCTIHVICF